MSLPMTLGDLDGDIYNIVTLDNEDLQPPAECNAANYEGAFFTIGTEVFATVRLKHCSGVEKYRLDRIATADDVAQNIVEYIDKARIYWK